MYIFGYFFQKAHFKGSSKKQAHRRKALGGGAPHGQPPCPLCSGEHVIQPSGHLSAQS